jgi:hypothetical protein
VLLVVGAVLLVSGTYIGYLGAFTTDSEGYSLSDTSRVNTTACAYFLAFHADTNPDDTAIAKWVVTSGDPGKELFVGWAWLADIKNYTMHFKFGTPKNWQWDYGFFSSPITVPEPMLYNNETPAPPPASQTFWLAQTRAGGSDDREGTVRYDLHWTPADEMKALVVMNPDGSPGIDAVIRFGTKVPVLAWLPEPLILLGVVLLASGVLLARRKR